MPTRFLLFFLFHILLATNGRSQVYIAPLAGYQLNLRNARFSQFVTGLQGSIATDDHTELILQVQRAWPRSVRSTDSAFSPNPTVPLYTAANKTLQPSAIAIAFGGRTRLAKIGTQDAINVVALLGVKWEKIAVSYLYDKANYTILNPDQTQRRTGLYGSVGAEFKHAIAKGYLFAQILLSTAPIGRKDRYPSSFNFVVPLSFNIGYSIHLTSGKYEKP
jgi:hypothetical protein